MRNVNEVPSADAYIRDVSRANGCRRAYNCAARTQLSEARTIDSRGERTISKHVLTN